MIQPIHAAGFIVSDGKGFFISNGDIYKGLISLWFHSSPQTKFRLKIWAGSLFSKIHANPLPSLFIVHELLA